ncbi:MAG: PAS domain S-box protein [Promethearchaeota archaeon]
MKYSREEIKEQFKDLFEKSLDLVYINDLKGKILDANDVALNTLGYTREEIQNLSFINLIDEEQLKKAFKFTKEIIETGKQSERSEYKLKTKNGNIIYVETYGIPLKKNGKPYAILGIGNDITEHKLADQKLKESEERFRALFKGGLVPTYTWQKIGNDFVLINYNNTAEKFTLGDVKNYLGFKASEMYIDRPDILKDLHTCFDKKTNIIREMKYYIQILKDEKDLLVKYGFIPPDLVLVHTEDITEKKKAEIKLIESEEKYRLISENAYDLISILNKKFKYEYINEQAFKHILGYSKNDLIGKSALKFCHSKDVENTARALFEGFKEGIGGTELRFKHKNGHWVYIEAKGSTFIDIDGELKALIISRDITERKSAELLVKEEIKKLKELDQLRKNLIIRVSHELKTPLIPVCGGTELLLDKYKDQLEKGVNDIIKMIGRGGQRLKTLINKLLDLSRLEYDMLSLDKQRSDLCKIIREISRDMMHLIKKRDLKLNLEIPDNLDLEIDAIRIEQVITNLLSNAIKNTPPKGIISINLQKENNWIKLIITDTGVGLTEKEMDIIFNRFGKIERYENGLEYIDITGSGLGLFISKEIIDLHGGKIWGESLGRNKGCTFYVKLPIK